jgi:hypothetical protein
MPRALATHGLHFPATEREGVLATLRARKAALESYACNYWVFEDRAMPGVMIEFYEASDVETLERAREATGVDPHGHPILSEVEL